MIIHKIYVTWLFIRFQNRFMLHDYSKDFKIDFDFIFLRSSPDQILSQTNKFNKWKFK
jgi:hypothetical protein